MEGFEIEEPGSGSNRFRQLGTVYAQPQQQSGGILSFISRHSFGIVSSESQAAKVILTFLIVIFAVSGYYIWKGLFRVSNQKAKDDKAYERFIEDCVRSGISKYECEKE